MQWALAQPAAVLEHTRFGAQALPAHEELLAVLRDLGLGCDPLEHEGIDADALLNLVAGCVSRSLGDPPSH